MRLRGCLATLLIVQASCGAEPDVHGGATPAAEAQVATPIVPQGGTAAFPIPTYLPAPAPPGSSSYDLGFEGRLSFADGCIRVVNPSGGFSIPVFPAGAFWRTPGRELEVQGTVFRDGDLLSSGGSQTIREFWRNAAPGYEQHTPIPDRCKGSAYYLVSGPVRRLDGDPRPR